MIPLIRSALTYASLSALGLALTCLPASGALIDGLQLHYDFENDTLAAGGINDQSGNTRNGSAIGVVDGTLGYTFTADVPAALGVGTSIRADGGDEIRVDSPNYAGIIGSGSRSVALWVKIDPGVTSNTNMHMVEWGLNNAAERYSFRREHAQAGSTIGGIRTEIQTDFRTGAAGGPSINDGNWHHVASVYDSSGGTLLDQVTMYIDGVAIATYIDGGNVVNFATASATVLIGGSTLVDRRWNGWMDEVAIWDRPLSPTEVSQLAAGASIPEPSGSLMLMFGIATLAVRRRR